MMLRADRFLRGMAIGCCLSVNCGIEQQNIMANQPSCRRTYRNELSEKLGWSERSDGADGGAFARCAGGRYYDTSYLREAHTISL
ncbi:hypothetical protein EN41_05040 [Agrobacterium tumefaciens]|nr:hypothetical protein EN41_05040 [Agrobacterium tumefaciens]